MVKETKTLYFFWILPFLPDQAFTAVLIDRLIGW